MFGCFVGFGLALRSEFWFLLLCAVACFVGLG